MTGVAPVTDAAVRGHTVITEKALRRLAITLARDAAHVPASTVTLSLADQGGALRATVRLPVAVEPFPVATATSPTLARRAETLRAGLIDGLDRLAGRRLATVDVRFEGVHRTAARRLS